MCPVHLCVVELEGDGQLVAEPFLPVSSPDEERIVEDAAVHAYGSVYFRINYSRRAYHHAVIGQVSVLTRCCHLCSMLQILTAEFVQVLRIEDVARTDFAIFVLHNRIDCNRVILNKFFTHGQ